MDLGRLLLQRRRRKKVRVHLHEGPTVEGLLLGDFGRHYVIALPKVLESPERAHEPEGQIEIPKHNVVFVQVLPE